MENQSENQQQVIASSPNTVSLTLGIVGVVVGVFALMACWVPILVQAVIPTAIIGTLLSFCGIGFAFFKKFKSIELPILGALMCITAISFSLYSAHVAAVAIQKAEQQALAEQERKEAEEERQRQAIADQMAAQRAQMIQEAKTKLPIAESELDTDTAALHSAQTNLDNINALFAKYQDEKPYLTNAVYKKIEGQLQTLTYERNSYAQSIGMAAPTIGGASAAYLNQVALNNQASRQKYIELNAQVAVANQQLQSIVNTSDQWQQDRLDAAQREFDDAQRKVSTDKQQVAGLEAEIPN